MVEYIPISKNLSAVVQDILKEREQEIELQEDISEDNIFPIQPLAACESGCSGSCSGSCTGSCSGSCSGSCTGSCTGTCTGTCSGDCKGACKGECKGECAGSCKGECKGTCKGECANTCQAVCETVCADACQSRCENGGETVQTYNNTKSKTFSWSSSIGTERTIRLSAAEWNDFAEKIEEVAPYCGEDVSVVRVNSQDLMRASDINSLLSALNKLNSTGVGSKTARASIIEAADFVNLPNKFNSAPIANDDCCELEESCCEKDPTTGTETGTEYGPQVGS